MPSLLTRRVRHFELTVSDLSRTERYFVDRLGFVLIRRNEVDPEIAKLFGAVLGHEVELRWGGGTIVLQSFQPAGALYPNATLASDQVFQHFAIVVADMERAHRSLLPLVSSISIGPQLLPARSGGATAFKFRDLDAHPLEFIQFPDRHDEGIDHSAIVVTDVARSIKYYRDQLGFRVASRQVNTGPEQDRLDGLKNVIVEVVALVARQSTTPHVELLAYRHPRPRMVGRSHLRDIAATRLVLEVEGLPPKNTAHLANGTRAFLTHDPDGHALLLTFHGSQ